MQISQVDGTDYHLEWCSDTQQYWVWEPEETPAAEVSQTSINAIKAGYFQAEADWTWDEEAQMMWAFNSYSNEWITEQDYQTVTHADATPAAQVSINYVWDEDNETFWIVWDPDVTIAQMKQMAETN